jgi:hypothetical protein
MNQIIVKNNFFEHPDKVVEFANTLDFKPPLSYQNWPGVRTDNLVDIDKKFFGDVMIKILSTLYGNTPFRFENSWLHFHKIKKGDTAKVSYHIDQDFEMASVIYLSEGDIDNGTTIFDENDKKQLVIANKYNSMVLYESNRLHGTTNMNFDEERLTLVAFFKDIKVAN